MNHYFIINLISVILLMFYDLLNEKCANHSRFPLIVFQHYYISQKRKHAFGRYFWVQQRKVIINTISGTLNFEMLINIAKQFRRVYHHPITAFLDLICIIDFFPRGKQLWVFGVPTAVWMSMDFRGCLWMSNVKYACVNAHASTDYSCSLLYATPLDLYILKMS